MRWSYYSYAPFLGVISKRCPPWCWSFSYCTNGNTRTRTIRSQTWRIIYWSISTLKSWSLIWYSYWSGQTVTFTGCHCLLLSHCLDCFSSTHTTIYRTKEDYEAIKGSESQRPAISSRRGNRDCACNLYFLQFQKYIYVWIKLCTFYYELHFIREYMWDTHVIYTALFTLKIKIHLNTHT